MTLDQFVTKYKGKKVCLGGFCECVALARQYIKDVLAFAQWPTVKGAYQIFDIADPKYYDKIKNVTSNYPKKGDIIIWQKEYGGYGHIAIVVEADKNGVLSFDQNYTGHGELPQLVNHNYNLILGWLRPKGDSMTCADDLKKCLDLKAEILDNSRKHLANLQKCRDYVEKSDNQIVALQLENKTLKNFSDVKLDHDLDQHSATELIKATIRKLFEWTQTK